MISDTTGRYEMRPIAKIHTDFPTKFGIPRQGGLIETLSATIVFEPEFRNPDALRGLEEFSHLWLIWQFSDALRETWSPTVRPPRLGGNVKKGVFATRSPFRPNPIGLSVVKFDRMEQTTQGTVLHISGADLMDGTPIYDIKPYLPHIDAIPDASGGFAKEVSSYELEVHCPKELLELLPTEKQNALIAVLKQDPRPSYQNDPNRIYGFPFAGFEVRFKVDGQRLMVCDVQTIKQ